ncbi:MAG: hypothetical protein GEU75_13790 [Dehalococcoidia bacterium]|nr:hypothetical protein [Dehalococcoidia bacterium]
MPEVELQLRQEDAKLIFLAVAYHLGRPGSELDPITKQPVEHGLAEIAAELQPQMRMAVARIFLRDNQLKRLLSGMLGSITELKAYPMLDLRADEDGSGRRSSVAGFDRSLLHLFPEVEEDPENALDIAERMLMLKRKMDQKMAELPPEMPQDEDQGKKRGWWPFKR